MCPYKSQCLKGAKVQNQGQRNNFWKQILNEWICHYFSEVYQMRKFLFFCSWFWQGHDFCHRLRVTLEWFSFVRPFILFWFGQFVVFWFNWELDVFSDKLSYFFTAILCRCHLILTIFFLFFLNIFPHQLTIFHSALNSIWLCSLNNDLTNIFPTLWSNFLIFLHKFNFSDDRIVLNCNSFFFIVFVFYFPFVEPYFEKINRKCI